MEILDVSFRELYSFPSTNYGLFGLYKYPAKFIPHVVLYAIENYSEKNDVIFDPFAGFGSVGVGCIILGRNYELWDLNPMLYFFHQFFNITPNINWEQLEKTIISLKDSKNHYVPHWDNISYWYPNEFLEELSKLRYGIEVIDDFFTRNLLLLSFLKTAKKFSYADEKVFKLYKSKRSIEKISKLLKENWKALLLEDLKINAIQSLGKLYEHKSLKPKEVEGIVKAEVDVVNMELEREVDIVLTSPPYIQAQEYIRSTKMELFWLGYKQEKIKELSRKEIPYRKDTPEIVINSETYNIIHQKINDEKLKKIYEKYFASIIYAFEKLSHKVRKRMLIFVGPVHVGGVRVPIDVIIIEHFKNLGWNHKKTYVDKIVSRNIFLTKDNINPSTGRINTRLETEHLLVLEK